MLRNFYRYINSKLPLRRTTSSSRNREDENTARKQIVRCQNILTDVNIKPKFKNSNVIVEEKPLDSKILKQIYFKEKCLKYSNLMKEIIPQSLFHMKRNVRFYSKKGYPWDTVCGRNVTKEIECEEECEETCEETSEASKEDCELECSSTADENDCETDLCDDKQYATIVGESCKIEECKIEECPQQETGAIAGEAEMIPHSIPVTDCLGKPDIGGSYGISYTAPPYCKFEKMQESECDTLCAKRCKLFNQINQNNDNQIKSVGDICADSRYGRSFHMTTKKGADGCKPSCKEEVDECEEEEDKCKVEEDPCKEIKCEPSFEKTEECEKPKVEPYICIANTCDVLSGKVGKSKRCDLDEEKERDVQCSNPCGRPKSEKVFVQKFTGCGEEKEREKERSNPCGRPTSEKVFHKKFTGCSEGKKTKKTCDDSCEEESRDKPPSCEDKDKFAHKSFKGCPREKKVEPPEPEPECEEEKEVCRFPSFGTPSKMNRSNWEEESGIPPHWRKKNNPCDGDRKKRKSSKPEKRAPCVSTTSETHDFEGDGEESCNTAKRKFSKLEDRAPCVSITSETHEVEGDREESCYTAKRKFSKLEDRAPCVSITSETHEVDDSDECENVKCAALHKAATTDNCKKKEPPSCKFPSFATPSKMNRSSTSQKAYSYSPTAQHALNMKSEKCAKSSSSKKSSCKLPEFGSPSKLNRTYLEAQMKKTQATSSKCRKPTKRPEPLKKVLITSKGSKKKRKISIKIKPSRKTDAFNKYLRNKCNNRVPKGYPWRSCEPAMQKLLMAGEGKPSQDCKSKSQKKQVLADRPEKEPSKKLKYQTPKFITCFVQNRRSKRPVKSTCELDDNIRSKYPWNTKCCEPVEEAKAAACSAIPRRPSIKTLKRLARKNRNRCYSSRKLHSGKTCYSEDKKGSCAGGKQFYKQKPHCPKIRNTEKHKKKCERRLCKGAEDAARGCTCLFCANDIECKVCPATCKKPKDEDKTGKASKLDLFCQLCHIFNTVGAKLLNKYFGNKYNNKEYYLYTDASFLEVLRFLKNQRMPQPDKTKEIEDPATIMDRAYKAKMDEEDRIRRGVKRQICK